MQFKTNQWIKFKEKVYNLGKGLILKY
jgi:hypothetical protein